MKYRSLTIEELAELEKEFVRFLASNSITGDDWVKIKEEKTTRAQELIEAFSDIVFDRVINNIEFLEFKSANDIKTFHCLPDKIQLIGLMIEGESGLDFSKNHPPQEMLTILQNSKAKLKLYQAEKTYRKARNQELFDMMESGCLISKGDLFRALSALK